jgi:hypothetical protein
MTVVPGLRTVRMTSSSPPGEGRTGLSTISRS